jgi:hypothetical protein
MNEELLVINGWYIGIVYNINEIDSFLEQTYCQCIN